MRTAAIALSLLAGLHAADAAGAAQDLAAAVNVVRTQGCGRRPAAQPALRVDPHLDRAAALLAAGRELEDALTASGYRAVQAAVLEVSGSPAAIERALADRGCKDIADAVYRDLGSVADGGKAWILLAAPLEAPPASQAAAVGARVLALVNDARAGRRRCGWKRFDPVAPLAPSDALRSAAAAHAADMAARSVMGHAGSDGSTPAMRATRAGYDWREIGENVASGQATAEQVVSEWLGSPHHCANIMSPDFTEMGVAFAASASGVYWAQVFGSR
jgi:uncharacterized protein YkwD